jgi:hypothetical protein
MDDRELAERLESINTKLVDVISFVKDFFEKEEKQVKETDELKDKKKEIEEEKDIDIEIMPKM